MKRNPWPRAEYESIMVALMKKKWWLQSWGRWSWRRWPCWCWPGRWRHWSSSWVPLPNHPCISISSSPFTLMPANWIILPWWHMLISFNQLSFYYSSSYWKRSYVPPCTVSPCPAGIVCLLLLLKKGQIWRFFSRYDQFYEIFWSYSTTREKPTVVHWWKSKPLHLEQNFKSRHILLTNGEKHSKGIFIWIVSWH